MLAFHLTPDSAVLFFELCQEFGADTEEKRIAILTAMAKYGQVQNIVSTSKTKDEYAQHLAKHFTVAKIEETKSNDLHSQS